MNTINKLRNRIHQKTPKSKTTWFILLLVLSFFVVQAGTLVANIKGLNTPDKMVSLALHGTTPTMSWSPNSDRLVINSAYHYFGDDHLISTDQGIYVLDIKTNKKTRIHNQQGYHPFWQDQKTVVWGHSPYEDGKAGLFRANEKENWKAEQLGIFEGVYHTLPGKNKEIIFWSGWPEYDNWVSYDPTKEQLTPLKLDGLSSWDTPSEQILNQCPQQVDNTRIQLTSETLELTVNGKKLDLGKITPFIYTYENPGPVKACLSPDGAYLAYIEGKQEGEFTLSVVRIKK